MNTNTALPPLDIPDIASGLSFLGRLPLANPAAAEEQLMLFLDSLLLAPPDPAFLLTLLEQARVPLCFVEEEMARRYHNKPLVLGEIEENYFQQVVEAWRKMCKGYALCAQMHEPEPDNPQYPAMMATILQRCLYYTGMIILEHYRARRELPEGVWLDLHGYYATAEEWGVAVIPVEDSLEHERQTTHCMAAYTTILLIDVAGPYSHSVRDLNLIRRWAGMWAPLVSVVPVPSEDLGQAPFVVELMKDIALHPISADQANLEHFRRLESSRLALQMNQMLAQLRQKITPSQLGLGEETAGYVIHLLEDLSRPWSQLAALRKFRRFKAEGTARVVVGFEAMHYLVSGKEFTQPDSASTYSRNEFNALFTFRDQVDPTQNLTIHEQPDYPVDHWEVVNHSASGFRLTRSSVGQKLAHGQVLALCPHDGENFILAQVTWLMQERDGSLIAGVAVLPGMPQGVGVRFPGAYAGNADKFVRAFMLPALPAIKECGSLVLPAGMYQASRPLEITADNRTWQVKLKNILQRGVDFERVSFGNL